MGLMTSVFHTCAHKKFRKVREGEVGQCAGREGEAAGDVARKSFHAKGCAKERERVCLKRRRARERGGAESHNSCSGHAYGWHGGLMCATSVGHTCAWAREVQKDVRGVKKYTPVRRVKRMQSIVYVTLPPSALAGGGGHAVRVHAAKHENERHQSNAFGQPLSALPPFCQLLCTTRATFG